MGVVPATAALKAYESRRRSRGPCGGARGARVHVGVDGYGGLMDRTDRRQKSTRSRIRSQNRHGAKVGRDRREGLSPKGDESRRPRRGRAGHVQAH